MKKLFLILLAACTLAACNSSDKDAEVKSDTTATTKADPAIIKFNEESHDFGKVTEGEKVTYNFKFYNGSMQPLIITNAVASCGCTTPTWPKTPVLPGKEGEISVTFNSAGRQGLQDKQITVTANTDPAQTVVHLIGEVLPKK